MAMPEHRPDWRRLVSQAIHSVEELLDFLEIDPDALENPPADSGFPLRVPRGYARRMRRGDSRDPLLLQVLATAAETIESPGYTRDPLAERDVMPVPGLLHKYHGRALLTVTGACAIHCRYCFRRHFPYSEANPLKENLAGILAYLAQRPEIHEVILSGGDPFMLGDRRLHELSCKLDKIAQLHTLRVHTRMPVVLPERVDAGLLAWIGQQRLQVVIVVHCNHPNEIDPSVVEALRKLRAAGATLLNQAVLLRGVNDNAAALIELSEALFATGVLPYYLHLLDKVQGAAHFAVDAGRARDLLATLRTRLPGYLVPRLVADIPGRSGKTPLG